SGAAADPWSTLIPGSYTAGMAGYIVGTYLDAAISGIGGATGSGAVEDTLTFYYDVAETQPIDGAEVWITNDVAGVDGGSVIAGTLVTDSSGIVTFALDTGTYWVHLQKGGYNFTTTYPRQLTVAAGGFSWA
ncbi:MAG TPA: hypothetical protein VMY35_17615, partial [Phycisphaerae bacterium]|nr:hypothetical protein [Phycisphaerae bacterium]